MPSDRLSGMAPVTAFTGLPATTPLSAFVNTVTKKFADIDWLDFTRKKHLDELDQLHGVVAATSAKKRRQARDRQAKSKAVLLQKFAIGDFVLIGQVSSQGQQDVPALAWLK
ncbi:hypothetical protein AaE_015650 [Aphanomyces astaci]|uniref:Uncharacterized protein n=1 Tax=Aphanomyces astaci TaxID=112090 RepID=A0A6A4Z6D1_APHAT|nr:hypothetical protein AaE_015650 [Aphanomyces astaci]